MHDRHDPRLHEDLPILSVSVTILYNDDDVVDDTTDNDQEGENQRHRAIPSQHHTPNHKDQGPRTRQAEELSYPRRQERT